MIHNDKFQNPAFKQIEEDWRKSRRTLNSLIDCLYKRAKLEEAYGSQMEQIYREFPSTDLDKTYLRSI